MELVTIERIRRGSVVSSNGGGSKVVQLVDRPNRFNLSGKLTFSDGSTIIVENSSELIGRIEY